LQYLENIRTVDRGVESIVRLFEERYRDNRTAYLFTADHGMTDWGSHGAGTDDETLTPFMAWGAGVRPTPAQVSISQVDLAPYQSALLGIAVPVNSHGILPVQLLRVESGRYLYQAAEGNMKQMLEQYHAKREERRRGALPIFFTDYGEFPLEALRRVEKEIARLVGQGRWEAAANACRRWVPKVRGWSFQNFKESLHCVHFFKNYSHPQVRSALLYFHRYHRRSQGVAITALFLTWNLAIYGFVTSTTAPTTSIFTPTKRLWLVLGTLALLIHYQRLTLVNYLYFLLPVYVGWVALRLLFNGRMPPGREIVAWVLSTRVKSLALGLMGRRDGGRRVVAKPLI